MDSQKQIVSISGSDKQLLDARMMPPPPVPAKRPKVVLEEDEYVNHMEKIIER